MGILETVYDMFPDVEQHRQPGQFPDMVEADFWSVVDAVRPFTMLTIEALYEVFQSVRYVVRSGLPGDLVECGVFLGGAVRAAADWAGAGGLAGRRFYAYDTFCGFPQDTAPETDFMGNVLKMYPHPPFVERVRDVLRGASCPADTFVVVEGDVAQTLRTTRPERIALLRLDTDDYASTRAELEMLYPLLVPGGVLIIDDYGHFQGARRATDEYLGSLAARPLLHRVSYSVRSGIKPA
jgi:hypothetical protein